MNSLALKPVSADSMLQASLPFLEVFCTLVGVVAVLLLLIALLHTFFAVRSSSSHLELYQFGEAKQRVDRMDKAQRGKQFQKRQTGAVH